MFKVVKSCVKGPNMSWAIQFEAHPTLKTELRENFQLQARTKQNHSDKPGFPDASPSGSFLTHQCHYNLKTSHLLSLILSVLRMGSHNQSLSNYLFLPLSSSIPPFFCGFPTSNKPHRFSLQDHWPLA